MITCTFEVGKKTALRHVAVGTIILRGNEVLLTRRSKQLVAGGKLTIPGGYMERDETVLETARREVLEETGYTVVLDALVTIHDEPAEPENDWQNVVIYFSAHLANDDRVAYDWETSEIVWVPIDRLPPAEEFSFNHGEILDRFRTHRSAFPLAVFSSTHR